MDERDKKRAGNLVVYHYGIMQDTVSPGLWFILFTLFYTLVINGRWLEDAVENGPSGAHR